VSPAILVAVALVAGAASLVIGLPAWRTWRERVAAEKNAERYLAWRGRAESGAPAGSAAMTSGERWRIVAGAVLALVAVACLVIGLSAG
jgi:hypothetical protein